MDMEELHESLGGTINYYKGASYYFGQHCHGWFFNYIRNPFCSFLNDEFNFEQICPQFHLIDSVFGSFELDMLLDSQGEMDNDIL